MTVDPYLADLAGRVVHDEIVAARAPWLYHVAAGQTLRIVDLEGNQAVDFLIYAAGDDATLKTYAELLYDQARLIAGLPLKDAIQFTKAV